MRRITICRFFALPKIKGEANSHNKSPRQTLSGAGSFFIPFGTKLDSDIEIDFIRGYGIWGAIDRFEPPAFFKSKPNTKTGFLIGHGEVLPYSDNKVTLSKKVDKWGKGEKLITTKIEEMPNYFSDNFEKYKSWLDI